ncbi:YafY family protein [Paracoccus sp. MKU1]|uniref:helix-turn-helix transcriptional regulator n=1 Tax=Paracoccus sp. MKU1 TaxID=1745182 RepID=UPI0007191185|nr:WYL domain-containing protein [Paracoccus sp. MKU1]KRW97168.1 hypothetical protein AQY21_05100 [Paracoccus sp. MKU1]
MRDAVLNVYPQLEEITEERRQKRWRFRPGSLGRMEEVTLEELAAAHRALSLVRREGDLATAKVLERLLAKNRAQLTGPRRNRLAPDLDAQLMDDGVAFRPGPRERIAPEILSALREAVLAGVMISANHRAHGSGKLSRYTRLGPIALLFGEWRQYLLAWSEYQDNLRLLALAGFETIRLKPDPYERPKGFDLQEWLSESFGIWREEPFEVEWEFLPEVAEEAATYLFHPKQEVEWLEDGSLMVRFRARGRQEME